MVCLVKSRVQEPTACNLPFKHHFHKNQFSLKLGTEGSYLLGKQY